MLGVYERIVDPLLAAVKRELGAIIARLHKMDFIAPADPISRALGGSSAYMKDLSDKLTFIKGEIFNRFNIGDITREWYVPPVFQLKRYLEVSIRRMLSIVRHTIKIFVLHVSIVKPLDESGKLQLATDMTELEFALSAFLLESPQSKQASDLDVIGEDYKTLRAMR